MKALRALFVVSMLLLGSAGMAVSGEAAKPVSLGEIRAELGRVNGATKSRLDSLRKEVQTTRRANLLTMICLAALSICVYVKLGMVEKNLRKSSP